MSAIAARLEEKGLVADRNGFVLLAKTNGVAGQIKAGEYAINRGLSPQQVLDQLVSGRMVQHSFTVIPGWTAMQVAEKLGEAGLDPNGMAVKLVKDRAFAASLDLPAPQLEGYLFPETYTYQWGEDAKTLLTRMVRLFQKTWRYDFADKAGDFSFNQHQIVTLASIIEKESGYLPERPKIAKAFLNRLQIGMPLQADPTVIYALGEKYTGRLTRADLKFEHPYNTYRQVGLPPGPICIPSANAIKAVLSPEEGSWLYFVATGQRQHVFSETLPEHLDAVRRYRRRQK